MRKMKRCTIEISDIKYICNELCIHLIGKIAESTVKHNETAALVRQIEFHLLLKEKTWPSARAFQWDIKEFIQQGGLLS